MDKDVVGANLKACLYSKYRSVSLVCACVKLLKTRITKKNTSDAFKFFISSKIDNERKINLPCPKNLVRTGDNYFPSA